MNKLMKKEIEKLLNESIIPANEECPVGGDSSNCSSCDYNGDYFFLNGECMSRNTQESKWFQLSIGEPALSGTNSEIRSVPILGWPANITEPISKDNCEIIAVIWQDLSKPNLKGIEYRDEDSKDDDYALSCIIEALRRM